MQKLGRMRQETRSGPGLLNQIDYIVLYIHPAANCLGAETTQGGQPNIMLRVPEWLQAGSDIFRC